MRPAVFPLGLFLFFFTYNANARATDLSGSATLRGKPLPNSVVWLEAPNAPRPPQKERIVLDQRNLAFTPTVLAVPVGYTVDFPNNDRVFHNVFSLRNGKKFDLGLYPVGAVKHVKFDRPGLSRIFCNIHPNMAAYVLAVESPYLDVTDKKGRFTLRGVPPGNYTYHAWRPGDKTTEGKVTVGPGAALEVRWP